MSRSQRLVVSVLAALVGVPLLYGSSAEEQEKNRRRLEKLQNQPAELARLRGNARLFLDLPQERRRQLIQLDERLYKEPEHVREHLLIVLERYAGWLEHIDTGLRKQVQDAPDWKARVEVIKKLREEEWLKRQPRAIQLTVAKTSGDERGKRIRQLRWEERKRHRQWQLAARFWDDLVKENPMPVRLADFSSDVRHYVQTYLEPFLTNQEQQRLKQAEGHWPRYPQALLAIADRYPPALPGHATFQNWAQLPDEVKKMLKSPKAKDAHPKRLRAYEGRPEFPKEVSRMARDKKAHFLYELWPYSYNCLSKRMQVFVEKELRPVLSTDEKTDLLQAEERRQWPEYPLTLKKLADNHGMKVPWLVLPGDPERWDRYRFK